MHTDQPGRLATRMFMLVATLFAALGLGTHSNTARAADIVVTNCNDSGPGSLRSAAALAVFGDHIDMRALTCGRINLTSGHIEVPRSIAISGPGVNRLTIDAGRRSSVFRGGGVEGFQIKDMTVQHGRYASNVAAFGGCIQTLGVVRLINARVRGCTVRAVGSARAFGAGIYAGRVELFDSQVTDNTGIDDGAFDQPEGGGLYVLGFLSTYRSSISGNHAKRAGGAWVGGGMQLIETSVSDNDGGAIEAKGIMTMSRSTISGNKNGWWTLVLDGSGVGGAVMIISSTISGNRSVYQTVNMPSGRTRTIANSTIVNNRHAGGCLNAAVFTGNGEVHIESNIIAKNTCGGAPYFDIGGFGDPGDQLVGGSNIIMSTNIPAPPDTITDDPRVAALADNGGPTLTHALRKGSPAREAGNNALGEAYDQRGEGFPRIIGEPDIGSMER